MEEEAKAQRGKLTHPKSHSQQVVEPTWESKQAKTRHQLC